MVCYFLEKKIIIIGRKVLIYGEGIYYWIVNLFGFILIDWILVFLCDWEIEINYKLYIMYVVSFRIWM